MNCPRCEIHALDERAQGDVVVDICRACKGIWLDRGELDKLLAQARRDDDDVDDELASLGRPRRYRRPDSDDDRHEHHDARHGAPRRKKRWYEAFGDLFD